MDSRLDVLPPTPKAAEGSYFSDPITTSQESPSSRVDSRAWRIFRPTSWQQPPPPSIPWDEDESFPISKPMEEYELNPPAYEGPSFQLALQYRMRHLPRRIADSQQPTGYRLARTGELIDEKGNAATLYRPFRENLSAFDEFGIGISLYFRILFSLWIIFFFCGIVCIIAMSENIKYQDLSLTTSPPTCYYHNCSSFYSSTYSSDNNKSNCSSTSSSSWSTIDPNGKRHKVPTGFFLLGSVYGTTKDDLLMRKQGIADIIVTGLLFVVAGMSGWFLQQGASRIDFSQQTPKDYSIVVTNPPFEVTNAQVYRNHYNFFSIK
jgi:hypothetical protein